MFLSAFATSLEHFGHALKRPTSGGGRRARDGARARGRANGRALPVLISAPTRPRRASDISEFGLLSLKTMTWKRGRAVAAPSSSAPAAMWDRAPRRGRQRAPPPARPLGAARGWLRPRRGVQAATGGLPRPHTKPDLPVVCSILSQPSPFLFPAWMSYLTPFGAHVNLLTAFSAHSVLANLLMPPCAQHQLLVLQTSPMRKQSHQLPFYTVKWDVEGQHIAIPPSKYWTEFTCQTDPKDSWARPWIAFVLGTERGNAALGKKIACDHVDRGGVAI